MVKREWERVTEYNRSLWLAASPTFSLSPSLTLARTLPAATTSSILSAECSDAVLSSNPALVVRKRSISSSVCVTCSGPNAAVKCWLPFRNIVADSENYKDSWISNGIFLISSKDADWQAKGLLLCRWDERPGQIRGLVRPTLSQAESYSGFGSSLGSCTYIIILIYFQKR